MLLLAFLIGCVAGLRALTAPTAVSIAATQGFVTLEGGWLAFLGYRYTPWILGLLAIGEMVSDQLPGTPSRKVPVQFATRILCGAVSGAAIVGWIGLLAGAIGAVAGTYSGAAGRAALARAFGHDRPAALLEDAVAILAACAIIAAL